jgi:hypothetical protein
MFGDPVRCTRPQGRDRVDMRKPVRRWVPRRSEGTKRSGEIVIPVGPDDAIRERWFG